MNSFIVAVALVIYLFGDVFLLYHLYSSVSLAVYIIIASFSLIPPFILIVMLINTWYHQDTRFNWTQIEISAKSLATSISLKNPDFLWGVATAAHQVEGDNKNNWTEFESIPGNIAGRVSGKACEHWTRYKDDIALMKSIGCDHYRFSVEWSRFQPHSEKDKFDVDVTKHYSDVIDECLAQGILPMITMHHFTNPIWFQSMGSFELEENLVFFENFCEYVYRQYSDRVKHWVTLNEPEIYILCGYVDGSFPPGVKNVFTAFQVLRNLMIAHTNVYYKCKAIKSDPVIGLAKNYCRIRTWTSWNPIEFLAAWGFNFLRDVVILRYLRSGKFWIPGFAFYQNKNQSPPLDFLGMNYYSDCWLHWNGWKINNEFREIDKQYWTDMEYPLYAEGFYDGLKELNRWLPSLPIIITENGLADGQDIIRELWLKRYLYSMTKAMHEGVIIHGYTYWSFCDNFEWAKSYEPRFGLFSVDYKTQERKLRKGGEFYKNVIEEYKKC